MGKSTCTVKFEKDSTVKPRYMAPRYMAEPRYMAGDN